MQTTAPHPPGWARVPEQVKRQLENVNMMVTACTTGHWDQAEKLADEILFDVKVPLTIRVRAHVVMAAQGGLSGLFHAEDALRITEEMRSAGMTFDAQDKIRAYRCRYYAQDDINHGRRHADGEDGETFAEADSSDLSSRIAVLALANTTVASKNKGAKLDSKTISENPPNKEDFDHDLDEAPDSELAKYPNRTQRHHNMPFSDLSRISVDNMGVLSDSWVKCDPYLTRIDKWFVESPPVKSPAPKISLTEELAPTLTEILSVLDAIDPWAFVVHNPAGKTGQERGGIRWYMSSSRITFSVYRNVNGQQEKLEVHTKLASLIGLDTKDIDVMRRWFAYILVLLNAWPLQSAPSKTGLDRITSMATEICTGSARYANDKLLARLYGNPATTPASKGIPIDAASDDDNSEDQQYDSASEMAVDEQQIEQSDPDHVDSENSHSDTASETDVDEQQAEQPVPDHRRVECMQAFENAHDALEFIMKRFQAKRPRDAALEDRLKGAQLELFKAHHRAKKTHGRVHFGGKGAPSSYYVLTEDSVTGDRLVLLDKSRLSDMVKGFKDEAYDLEA